MRVHGPMNMFEGSLALDTDEDGTCAATTCPRFVGGLVEIWLGSCVGARVGARVVVHPWNMGRAPPGVWKIAATPLLLLTAMGGDDWMSSSNTWAHAPSWSDAAAL